ncbi:unnamed protein product [Didymodactylos carnosus]|uniref:SH3 domain-containing protein n=1 Tax=Didymodactylos carnosus TaxID=1234261 RepID=A0A813SPP4_9BILA|nr:unnamed protein product [Didymodactylos carnosus]CAF0845011.1 unnamed protein product [Didymodactylos carnosus]CAF3582909.1 unnamed protein product [Didymodactylos carnosus]CAF3630185.1 unnamed protein product [Didymodactylos carnosus]
MRPLLALVPVTTRTIQRNFRTSTIRHLQSDFDQELLVGQNLPFNIQNKWKLATLMIGYISLAVAIPLFCLQKQQQTSINNNKMNSKKETIYLIFSYLGNESSVFSRKVLRLMYEMKIKCKIIFKRHKTIVVQFLKNLKGCDERKTGVIYGIECNDCQKNIFSADKYVWKFISNIFFASPKVQFQIHYNWRRHSMSLNYAKALHNFQTQKYGDLNFYTDDIIEIVEKVDSNWLRGKLNGTIGLVPITFIQIITLPNISGNEQFFIAISDYSSSHVGDLQFKTGDILVATEQISNDWLRGYSIKEPNRNGIFPITFVTLKNGNINSINDNNNIAITSIQPPLLGEVIQNYSSNSNNTDSIHKPNIDLTYGDWVVITKRSSAGYFFGECGVKIGWFPEIYIKLEKSTRAPSLSRTWRSLSENESPFIESSQNNYTLSSNINESISDNSYYQNTIKRDNSELVPVTNNIEIINNQSLILKPLPTISSTPPPIIEKKDFKFVRVKCDIQPSVKEELGCFEDEVLAVMDEIDHEWLMVKNAFGSVGRIKRELTEIVEYDIDEEIDHEDESFMFVPDVRYHLKPQINKDIKNYNKHHKPNPTNLSTINEIDRLVQDEFVKLKSDNNQQLLTTESNQKSSGTSNNFV